ncbi:hypothetical protein BB464_06740 [Helicobacter pylori]|nr:hypothetical protein BB464_06740 [Helicobacter pylori]
MWNSLFWGVSFEAFLFWGGFNFFEAFVFFWRGLIFLKPLFLNSLLLNPLFWGVSFLNSFLNSLCFLGFF